MKPVLVFEKVSMRFDGSPIFNDLSFNLKLGETVGITGPSGCGKSTVLRIAVDLASPTAGTVRFYDKDVKEWDPTSLRTKMILVPQEASMFPGRVRENLIWPLTIHDRVCQESDLIKVLEDVLLEEEQLDKVAANLSGGQKQRVAMARALLLEPDVLLLDEPTSALDEDATLAVEETINRLLKDQKQGVLIVTHNKEQAERFTSRIIVMEGGGN